MGLDATHKWPGETTREWGRALTMDPAVRQRMQQVIDGLLAPPRR
jgi:4-hydroxy-3-polyprenylbenzoate decarboxylase